jgi:hypothetical protein
MNLLLRYFLLLLLFSPLTLLAQKPQWEIGLFLGASNYYGDLAPNIVVGETKGAIGGMLKKDLSEYFAYSLNLNYGVISGNDNDFEHLKARNIHFKSEILEISPQLEFNFFRFGTSPRAHHFTPYVFAGLSYFKFNPKAKLNDEWIRLQPLTTEGQGIVDDVPKKYNLWQFAVPIGAGVKFSISNRVNLALHSGFRSTFTDYLDDVSGAYADRNLIDENRGGAAAYFSDPSGEVTGIPIGKPGKLRGNPDTKDWYIFTGVTLSYIIQGSSCYTF